MKKLASGKYLIITFLLLLTGCSLQHQATPAKTRDLTIQDLNVRVLYPIDTTETAGTKMEMGQSIKGIIEVLDVYGNPVKDASVTLSVRDAGNHEFSNIPAFFGKGDVYRTDAWMIPHKMQAGN